MRTKLCCRQLSAANPFENSGRGDLQHSGRCLDGQLRTAAPLAGEVNCDLVPISKRADTPRGPAFSMRCAISIAIQDGGDHPIGLQPCEPAYQFNGVRVGDKAMLSDTNVLETKLRMIAAFLMHQQLHFSLGSGHDNFREYDAQDTLFVFQALRTLPQSSLVAAERKE